MADHMASARKQLLAMGLAEEAPKNQHPFPRRLDYLWSTFCRLDKMRDMGFTGPVRILPERIESVCRLLAIALDPWEVDAIWALDDARIEAFSSNKTVVTGGKNG